MDTCNRLSTFFCQILESAASDYWALIYSELFPVDRQKNRSKAMILTGLDRLLSTT